MEAVLLGAQHRETGASRVLAIGTEGGISSPDGRCHHRQQDAAVDQFRCMKKQNGAEKTCAIFLPEIGLEKGFSTASTSEFTGWRDFVASVQVE